MFNNAPSKSLLSIVSIVLLCFLLPTKNLHANEKLRLVSYPIPIMVQDESRGVFVELTSAIANSLGIELEITVMPTKRAILMFEKNMFDGIFPALDMYFKDGRYVRSSEVITTKQDFIFSLSDQAIYRNIADLQGKTVGITRGYPYSKDLLNDEQINFSIVHSDEANAVMLLEKRIDAFIIEERTGVHLFKGTNSLDKIHYDKNHPLSNLDVFYAFQANPQGQDWSRRFDKVLESLKKSGEYQRIMSKAKGALNEYSSSLE